ncbi:VOC family protein [Blastococcus sp. TF02A-30]|uniref:VOC family protein n=1 Tax=Blastococcus sp. TF02A-30 TaxID=2250580 RepID=UPI000DEB3BFC|nr:VOC family protein [Blastococcus sp. TF02A-30]RBY83257.1 VOC family protein [Blastococcus sp. TF02A-30]
MDIRGIVFAGTATSARAEMRVFAQEVLGMRPAPVEGVEADLFDLPDGSSFAIASPEGMGPTQRSLGFLVDDLDAAVAELVRSGVAVDPSVSGNERERYVHFTAPDGQLYELVERRTPAAGPG